MVYDDYHHENEVQTIEKQFHEYLTSLCGVDIDSLFQIKKLYRTGKIDQITKKYKLNKKSLIYSLIVLYSVNTSHRLFKRFILNHPYIKGTHLKEDCNTVETEFGNYSFRVYMPSIIKVLKSAPNLQLVKRRYQIYKGFFYGNCHAFARIGNQDTHCITAFIPGDIEDIKYLHTYIENKQERRIYDISRNLVFDIDTFNDLVEPEIVSDIPTMQVREEMTQLKGLTNGIKEYLVERDKIKKLIKQTKS